MDRYVGVIGTSLWTSRIAAMLERHTPIACRPVCEFSFRDFWQVCLIIITRRILRVGFRPGVMRPRGLLIDCACSLFVFFRGELSFYWTGSDVQRTAAMLDSISTMNRVWGKMICNYLLSRSRHCAAAPWLVKELLSIGVEATCLPFPSPTSSFEGLDIHSTQWPNRFSVLSYVPDHNFDNYCGNELISVAKRFPNVEFRIMGGEGNWCARPPSNVTFLGWTDPLRAYLNSVVVVRAVRHDALGGTVREALLCGRHVIYTHPHNHTIRVSSDGSAGELIRNLNQKLEELLKQFRNGILEPNLAGRNWVIGHLSERRLAIDVHQWLLGKRFS